ncbi:MAG: response regulator transcription factor [Spirochaetaceae bacterium]|nr:response regulator transcription factor [Spirochaetaceae bacterium]
MKRILVVEDDLAIAELERDYLEAAGFAVELSADGAQALSLAKAGDYDLFLVDLMLPGLDGFGLCTAIRAHSEKPILVVSARAADIDKVRALGLGADDYVTKPFSPAELVARVRAHIDRYERLVGAAASDIVSAGELTIDVGKKAVLSGGQPVQLTATEFGILLLLARSPGRVYSKEEIFERLRGAGFYGDAGAVAVYVRRLREKIEADPAKPRLVETVWGMGYRFREAKG